MWVSATGELGVLGGVNNTELLPSLSTEMEKENNKHLCCKNLLILTKEIYLPNLKIEFEMIKNFQLFQFTYIV